jgi:hypothetical protein
MPPGNVARRQRVIGRSADRDVTVSATRPKMQSSVERGNRCDGYWGRTFQFSGTVMTEDARAPDTMRSLEDDLHGELSADAGDDDIAPVKGDR